MKFIGVGSSSFVNIFLSSLHPYLVLKGVDGTFDGYSGYFAMKGVACESPGYLQKTGSSITGSAFKYPYNKPCAHLYAKAVAALLKLAKQEGKSKAIIWAEKHKFTVYHTEKHIVTALKKKFATKGFTCLCDAATAQDTLVELSEKLATAHTTFKTKIGTLTAPSPKKAHKPTMVAATTGTPFTADAIEADPVVGGEVSKAVGLRDLYAAVCGLYVLHETEMAVRTVVDAEAAIMTRDAGMSLHILAGKPNRRLSPIEKLAAASRGEMLPPESVPTLDWQEPFVMIRNMAGAEASLSLAVERLKGRGFSGMHMASFLRRFYTFKRTYDDRLARQFFDYLTSACMGEARHSSKLLFPDGGKPAGRSAAYAKATLYDPRTILPVMERCFNDTPWGGGYGGSKWGNIAHAATLYLTTLRTAPLVFADHVVDISHNGGLAFNKHYIFALPVTSGMDEIKYMKMLDAKRKGSLLSPEEGKYTSLPLVLEESVADMYRETRSILSDWEPDWREKPAEPGKEEWVIPPTTVQPEALPRISHRLQIVEDPKVKLLKWGTETFSMLWGKGGYSSSGDEEEDAPSSMKTETYPEMRTVSA